MTTGDHRSSSHSFSIIVLICSCLPRSAQATWPASPMKMWDGFTSLWRTRLLCKYARAPQPNQLRHNSQQWKYRETAKAIAKALDTSFNHRHTKCSSISFFCLSVLKAPLQPCKLWKHRPSWPPLFAFLHCCAMRSCFSMSQRLPRVLLACSIWFASVPPVARSITR